MNDDSDWCPECDGEMALDELGVPYCADCGWDSTISVENRVSIDDDTFLDVDGEDWDDEC